MFKFQCAIGHDIAGVRTEQDIKVVLACVYCKAALDENMRVVDRVIRGDKSEEIKDVLPN